MTSNNKTKISSQIKAEFNLKLPTIIDDPFLFRIWFESFDKDICWLTAFLLAYNYDKIAISREIYDMCKKSDYKIDYLMTCIRILSHGRINFSNLEWWNPRSDVISLVWSKNKRPKFNESQIVSSNQSLTIISDQTGLRYEYNRSKICTIYSNDVCPICFIEFTEEEVKNNSIKVCTLCIDDQIDTEKHIVCKNCFIQNIQINKRNNSKITCMSFKCKATYLDADIKAVTINSISQNDSDTLDDKILDPNILNESTFTSAERKEMALNINEMVDDGMICPICQEFCIIIGDFHSNITKKRYCHACDNEICLDCMYIDHPNRTCNQITNNISKLIRKIIEKAISEGIMHECPVCHVKYTKESGCNHMTCPQCKEHSCYLCGQHIMKGGPNNSIYWHFRQNNSKCSTYNHARIGGDTEDGNHHYNHTKIIDICKNILIENSGNKMIHDELIRQIIKISAMTEYPITYKDLNVSKPKSKLYTK